MKLTVKISGLAQTTLNMSRRSGMVRAEAPRAIRDTLTDVFRDVQDSFDQSRQIGGSAWKPLAASTLAQKRRLGFSSKPLIRNRGLQKNWNIKVAGMVGTLELLATGKKGVPYGVYQHDGTGRIPSRKFTPTETVIRRHLQDAFKRLAQQVAQ